MIFLSPYTQSKISTKKIVEACRNSLGCLDFSFFFAAGSADFLYEIALL
jgi:hypothetical protein